MVPDQKGKWNMQKMLFVTILVAALGLPGAAAGQGGEKTSSARASAHPFLQPNSWWNLYFANDNNPLKRAGLSIAAVKVVEIDKQRPSWVKIRFPKDKDEHLSILKATVRARKDSHMSIDDALGEWEKTISDWESIWINLDFVVYVTRVEPNAPAGESATRRSQ